MGKQASSKLNIPMCAACILLTLTMISVYMTSGLYARYVTTASSSDSARVAKFAVSGAMTGDVALEYAVTNSGEYTLTVTNNSEVTVEYSVSIVFNEAVHGGLDVTLDNDKTGTWNGNKLTFADVGTMQPNTGSQTHTIKFSVADWTYFTAGTEDESISKTMAFTVNIHAAQVD